MTRMLMLRAGGLYLPLLLALAAGLVRRQPARQFPACLLSLLWSLPALLIVQRVNQLAGWWTFAATGTAFCGMPVELLLGWAVLWGAVPQVFIRRTSLPAVAGFFIGLDLLLMPQCTPLLVLGRGWIFGEAFAAAFVLAPALLVARWTLDRTHLRGRSAIQVAIAASIFLFLCPELAFALRPGAGWQPLLELPGWKRQLAVGALMICAVPGLGAVAEFARRGGGTPIPYDPPGRLVTSGIYRFVANPMQLSCAVVMLLWAVVLRNGWLVGAAVISVVYSAGIANWDEGADLGARFGEPWRAYRREVRNWMPRWRPYVAGSAAKVYMAETCGVCSEVWRWIEARAPLGLEIVAAETLPPGSIRRMRYEPGDGAGAVEGVRAMGCVLEHLNLGWAFAGAALRLPGVWQLAQLAGDASGLGPQDLVAVRAGDEVSCRSGS